MIRRLRQRGAGVLIAAMLAAGLMLAACGGTSDTKTTSGSDTPKPGGTFKYPLFADPLSIEPLNAQETEGMQVAHQVFEGLVKYEPNAKGEMEAVPAIAEKWETTDTKVWTFHLKKGVMFQAPVSREVKAQDFVDSWTRVTTPKNRSQVSYILAPIEGCDDSGFLTGKTLRGAKALDDYTLQVTLRYPYAEFAQSLGHTVAAVTPVEYIEKVGVKSYGLKPVGTGPYAVESWRHWRTVELVKNAAYWDKQNAGYVDRIHMPVIKEAATRWLEFQKGTLDYSDVPPGQVKVAESHAKTKGGQWQAKRWPQLGTYLLSMNMTDPLLGKSLELRKALVQSADTQRISDTVNEGVTTPATGFVAEGTPGYVAGQSPYTYDPEAAKAAIATLDRPLTFKYWYNDEKLHKDIAQVLQAGWKDIGVDVKLESFEWGVFLDKVSSGNQAGVDKSQIFRIGWMVDYPSMDNFLYPLFQSSQTTTGSYTFYKNAKVDDLLQQARSTKDAAARSALYAQAEKQICGDAPAIPLFYYRDFRMTNNRIGGFTHNPMAFTDMWKVWVK